MPARPSPPDNSRNRIKQWRAKLRLRHLSWKLTCREDRQENVFSRVSRIMDKLQVLLSIMVRYGILVFAAALRRDRPERVAKPGPFQDTAPAGLRRRGCTALARLFQANGMNSVLRGRYARHAMFGPRLNNHGFGPHAAFGAGKTGCILQNRSPRPSGIGPARCGPGISIMSSEVMHAFFSLGAMLGVSRWSRPAQQPLPDRQGPSIGRSGRAPSGMPSPGSAASSMSWAWAATSLACKSETARPSGSTT